MTDLPPPAAASPTATRYGLSPAFWIAVVALVAMIVGSIGPWITSSEGGSLNGTSRDGTVIIVIAVVALILVVVFASIGQRPMLWACSVLGVLATIICIADLADISNKSDAFKTVGVSVSAGWGIWLALIGSAVFAIATFVARATAPVRT